MHFCRGPGKPYVESRGTKVWWRPRHTGHIRRTRKTMNTKLSYMPQHDHMKTLHFLSIWGPEGGRGDGARASKIRLGSYWFTSTLSFILIYMSNMEAIWNFWAKIQIMNNKCNCFRGHGGPLHKIQRYRGHQNVGICSPHHTGDICTTREKIGGAWGTFNGHTGHILLSRSHLTHSYK